MHDDKLKQLRERIAKSDHECLESIDQLIEAIDRDRTVGASLFIARDGDVHAFAAVLRDDTAAVVPGAGDYIESLQKLIEAAPSLSIGIQAIPTWPPCEDPRWCEPGVIALRQHYFEQLITILEQLPVRPPRREG